MIPRIIAVWALLVLGIIEPELQMYCIGCQLVMTVEAYIKYKK
jgi:hypothetical protein